MNKIIELLESTNSRLEKEAIVKQAAIDGNEEFFEGARLALSKFVTFGVKKVPTFTGPDGQGLPWVAFKELCHLLATRQLTGHDARDAIELALSASTEEQWNGWYRRILIKDLRCGTSEATINKVLADFPSIEPVPLFECMLAHDGAKHEKKVKGKKLLEIKLDGVRVLTIIDVESKTVTQYTRNGKLLENFSHITNALEQNIECFDRSYVLDGEMISASFQQLMTQVHRKSDVKATDAVLMLFDILPLSEFINGKSTLGQKRRRKVLEGFRPVFEKLSLIPAMKTGYMIDIVPQIEVDLDTAEGRQQFNDYNKKAIADGFEGIMIKDVDAKYECKRSAHWLKQKPFIEVSLKIVGVEEGTGKYAGKLGAIICEGVEDDKLIKTNCGSGFSDDQREELFENQGAALLGQIVEIRADAITQNQDGSYSLRFPRFKTFRGFKAGEKI